MQGKRDESVKSAKVKSGKVKGGKVGRWDGGKVGDPARREGIGDRLWVIGDRG